jgi:hypothetical protein
MKPASLSCLIAVPIALLAATPSTPALAAPTAPASPDASVQLRGSDKPGAGTVLFKGNEGTITGSYSNQPGDGLTLKKGRYIVKDPAQFNNNGLVKLGSGIFATGSELTVNGGTFTQNRFSALDAIGRSRLIINNGTFKNNTHGVRLYSASRITVNGGLFSQNIGSDFYAANLSLTEGSTGAVNGGTFEGSWYGIRADKLATLQINGGDVKHNVFNGIQCVDAAVVFNGGNITENGFDGAFICSTTGKIKNAKFTDNGRYGVYLTSSGAQNADGTFSPGAPAFLAVSGGTFAHNVFAGLAINAAPDNPSTATIKDGTFIGNGLALQPYYSGGVLVGGASALTISGGKFNGNNGSGVHVLEPGSSVAITGGDFTANIDFGHGLQVDGGGSAVISGGDFSKNYIGVRLGPAFSFSDDDVSGSAIINGGTFHDVRYALKIGYDSDCIINGGDFSSEVVALDATFGSDFRIYGGTFTAPQYTFTAAVESAIHLYGKFDNYDVSASPVTLSTDIGFLTGSITGTLQNNVTPQTFTYRLGPGASLVLHPPAK